ncbi:MAG: outer membrane protein [Maricaulaceae bacterium]
MKKHLLIAATAATLMAAPSVASAQDDSGWYLRGNAGYGVHTDIDITGDVVGDVESEGNATGSVGLGYDFGNNWRLEGDFAQLQTDLGAISQYPHTSAKLETKTAMINAIYDFSGFGRWEPYIGAGIGIVRGNATIEAHDFPSGTLGAPGVVNVSNPTCVGGVACGFKDGDTGLGWQLLAGLGYAISDNLTWDTHYRYMNSTNLDFKGVKAPALGSLAAAAASYEDVGAHSLMTGFRYKFGEKAAVEPVVLPVAPTGYTCWDGSMVVESYECPSQPQPQTYTCWDGTLVYDVAQCPAQPQPETYTCWDGSLVYDVAQCPAQVTQYVPTYNVCGASPVEIFNVDTSKTPKSISRLGTLPEFGDSHGLTADQFYNKLQARYNADAGDRAYLNYLFKSMGYENGFRDAQSYMFSEEVLPVGATGMLGLGEQHHYAYSVLNTSDRDREAFRIQSANGTVVHFMKTCGNYMYVCE